MNDHQVGADKDCARCSLKMELVQARYEKQLAEEQSVADRKELLLWHAKATIYAQAMELLREMFETDHLPLWAAVRYESLTQMVHPHGKQSSYDDRTLAQTMICQDCENPMDSLHAYRINDIFLCEKCYHKRIV